MDHVYISGYYKKDNKQFSDFRCTLNAENSTAPVNISDSDIFCHFKNEDAIKESMKPDATNDFVITSYRLDTPAPVSAPRRFRP